MLIFASGNFTPGVVQATACTSVVYVDSAVRWRCNGAGGLFKKIVVSGAQRCTSRSRLTVFVRQRYRHRLFVRRGRRVAQMFSCRSRRGEFCEPPQGGASARTAEAGLYFYKPQPPEHLFPPPFRVAASCIFQSAAEFANNSVVCHSEEQSDEESVTFPQIDS